MLVDTHSHLHFPACQDRNVEIYDNLKRDNIFAITVGTAISTSKQAITYAQNHDGVWASVGYHPDHVTSKFEDNNIEPDVFKESYNQDKIMDLAKKDKVVAIGEIGLDFSHLDKEWTFESAYEAQKKVFLEQVEVANDLNKPIIVHMRDAKEKGIEVLRQIRLQYPDLKIIRHAFTDTWEEAQQLLDLNCYFGIGGIVTFKPRKDTLTQDVLINIVKKLPLENILLETDCPWLAPVPKRGELNEPAFVKYIAEYIAEAKKITLEELSRQTTENAKNVFDLNI